jgi:hypothetical protein
MVPNFAHILVTLHVGIKQKIEGHTRAQRQDDFTYDNFNLSNLKLGWGTSYTRKKASSNLKLLCLQYDYWCIYPYLWLV